MKKLLVVSTTFFPHRVVGAIRITEWCKHLPEFGWQPTVLARHHGVCASPQELASEVHPAVQVHYLGTRRPTASNPAPAPTTQTTLRSKAKHLAARGLQGLAVPDPSRLFWRSCRGEVAAFVDRERPAVILTTGPPHSNHDIGLWLSHSRPEVPWVADFRDPYLIDHRYGPRGVRRVFYPLHARYEREVYERAALVTHAIPTQARWAKRHYPELRNKLHVLTNGYPAAYDGLSVLPSSAGVVRGRLVTMGVKAEEQRAQLARVLEAMPQITTRHIGRAEPVDARLKSSERHTCSGQLPQPGVLPELQKADVLVATLRLGSAVGGGLSSKLFEFLALGKPILVINPTKADRILLRGFSHTRALSTPTDAELAEAVRWSLSDAAQPTAAAIEAARERFSRRNQVRQLAAWLDAL